MENVDAYKLLVKIKRIIENTNLFVKKEMPLSEIIIKGLNDIGEMATELEACVYAFNDEKLINEIKKIDRAVLFQINGWYDIEHNTRLSVTNCIRSLGKIAKWEDMATLKSNDYFNQPKNEPQQTVIQELPKELDTNKAKAIFNKLVNKEYCECDGNSYKWIKSKALLGYFVDVANDKLKLKHGQKRKIKPFEILFNVKGLTSAINDYRKTGDLPIGHKEIDNMFP